MTGRFLFAAALVLAMTAPIVADSRSQARTHVEFGITIAQKNLWKDATQQWERAVELDPTYAAAWNNLGIGYEQIGDFEKARKAYERAMSLEPNNTMIANNYAQFREIYDRQSRRRR